MDNKKLRELVKSYVLERIAEGASPETIGADLAIVLPAAEQAYVTAAQLQARKK